MKLIITIAFNILLLCKVIYAQPSNLSSDYQNIDMVTDEFNNNFLDFSKWDDWTAYSDLQIAYRKTSRLFTDGIQLDNINNSTNDPNGNDNIRWVSESNRNFLRIVTKYEEVTRRNPYYNESTPLQDFLYTTAQLWSKRKMRYGYYEISSRMPDNSADIQANFWLYYFQDYPGFYSEIDIFEHRTYWPYHTDKIAANVHSWKRCPDSDGYNCCDNTYIRPYNYQEYQTSESLNQNFHVYGVEYKPGQIDFYFNGILVQTFTDMVATNEILNSPNVDYCLFENQTTVSVNNLKEMAVGFDIGLLNEHDGPRPQSGYEQYFDIDYFRYYKKKPQFSAISKVNCNMSFFDVTITPGTIDDVFSAFSSTNAQWQNLGNNVFRIIPNGSANPVVIYTRFIDPYGIITENTITIPIEQTNVLDISGINTFCQFNNTSTFTLNQTNNTVDVVWSVTNGTIISSDNQSCTVQWNSNAQLNGAIVSAQLIGTTPECTKTISHPISSCCSSSDLTVYQNLEVPANTQLHISNENAQFIGNVNVYGKLFIEDFSSALLSDNTSITIHGSGELNISDSYISSCNNMWDGIKTNSSSSKIFISYSTIEDAKTAVEVKDAHTIFISNTIFNKNRNHLDLFRRNTGLTYNIINNTFDCWNGSTNMCLKSPFLNQKTQTAFKFDSESTDHDLSVGYNGSNIIRNASMGLYFLNASATISNFELSYCDEASALVNMKPFNFNNNNVSNCLKGITCYNSETNVNNSDFEVIDRNAISSVYGGTISVNSSNFVSISTAVYANYISAVNISNCNVNKVSVGFRMLNNKSAQVRIEDNILANVRNYGIYQVFHYNGESIVKNNQINLVYPVLNKGIGCGIYFAENEKYQGAKHRISLNQITNAKDGIWFTTITNSSIFNNTISMYGWDVTDQQLFNGIKLENSLNCQVRENSVSGSSDMQSHYWVNGIFVENSMKTMVHCNYVNNLGRGFFFSGNTPETTFTGNYMGNCYDHFVLNWNYLGLGDVHFYETNSTNPLPSDNRWMGSSLGFNTLSFFSNYFPIEGKTRFHHRNLFGNNEFNPINNEVIGNDPNFPDNYKRSIFEPNSIINEDLACDKDWRRSDNEDDKKYAETTQWPTDKAGLRWNSREYVFESAKYKTSENVYIAASVQQMYDSLQTVNLGYFKDVGELMELDSLAMAVDDNLNLLQSLLPTDAVEMIKKQTDYTSYKSSVDAIFPYNFWIKAFNTAVSSLCPHSFGPGVYTSRVLANLNDTLMLQNNTCNLILPSYTSPQNRLLNDNYLEKQNVNVYPNPSKGKLTFEASENLKIIHAECFDLQGRLIKSSFQNNSDFTSEIEVIEATKGLYILKIITENKKISYFKIAIEP